jgi:Carboxypeptidase regulatory-like domain
VTRNAAVAALLTVFLAAAVFPFEKKNAEEEKLRMVQGAVLDAQENPIVGAVVQLKNSKTLQVRSFITQDKGLYQFHGLDPNVDYVLKAQSPAGESAERTLSSFDSRKQPVLNLKIEAKK